MIMSEHKIGERIGAILSATETEAKLLGYGVFAGEEIPPDGFCHAIKMKNPKLVLDNGTIVWGQECWWGSEEAIKASIGDRKVIEVSKEIEEQS